MATHREIIGIPFTQYSAGHGRGLRLDIGGGLSLVPWEARAIGAAVLLWGGGIPLAAAADVAPSLANVSETDPADLAGLLEAIARELRTQPPNLRRE